MTTNLPPGVLPRDLDEGDGKFELVECPKCHRDFKQFDPDQSECEDCE